MIVQQIGYLKIKDVKKLKELFSIYETHKGTHILVTRTDNQTGSITYAKKDRLPWKYVRGKKITNNATRIFSSGRQSINEIDTTKWNMGMQIMAYYHYGW